MLQPPKFTILDRVTDERSMRFRAVHASAAVMNALRRSIIAHTPSAAFHYDSTLSSLPDAGVIIKDNTSVIHNEMLGSRLSLVPVSADERLLHVIASQPEAYRFRVQKYNTGPTPLHVTTGDITVHDATTGDQVMLPDGRPMRDALFPANPITGHHIPLTLLKANPYNNSAGQRVHMEAVLTVKAETEGRMDARKHARWSPVSACFFTNTLNADAAHAAFERLEEK
jgi:hypothetical protein